MEYRIKKSKEKVERNSPYFFQLSIFNSIQDANLLIRQHSTRASRGGFTLVEMIIYIAFFSILSTLAVESTMMVMRSFYTLRLTQSVSQSATVALERLSREIRNAYDFDVAQSTFGTNPGRLMLNTKDAGGANTTMEFYMSAGNQLWLKEGGVDKGALVTKSVTLTNLIFRSIITPNSKAIKVEATLQDSRGATVQSVKFYDTIVLRGSVH